MVQYNYVINKKNNILFYFNLTYYMFKSVPIKEQSIELKHKVHKVLG